MSNIHSNSLFAFEDIKPIKGDMQKKVLVVINLLGEATAFEVAKQLNVSVHQITGRINELMYECQAIKVVKVVQPRKRNVYSIREE